MVEVKICGVTSVADAEYAARCGAWAIGVNFWPGSKRVVTIETAREIVSAVGAALPVVGVFVDARRDEIERTVDAAGLAMVQLHGDELPSDCLGWSVPVIKALRLQSEATWETASTYPVDYVLVDSFVAGEQGGTGQRLVSEWVGVGLRDRLILAGGLDPDNVASMIHAVSPFAVDVASGVESAPGRKEREKVKRFIDNAHHA